MLEALYAMSDVRTFKRLTLKERGHFSNYFTIYPVLEMAFAASNLTIRTLWRTSTFRYGELHFAVELSRHFKAYGAGTGGYLTRTLVRIIGPSSAYTFDLSSQFPDFKPQDEVMSMLEHHLGQGAQ